jgi:galactitol-specific phosphotransferase system IIB component
MQRCQAMESAKKKDSIDLVMLCRHIDRNLGSCQRWGSNIVILGMYETGEDQDAGGSG